MDIIRLIDGAPDWTDQTWAQRIDDAASLLFIHGYISQTQRSKIATKMNGQFEQAIAQGLITQRKSVP